MPTISLTNLLFWKLVFPYGAETMVDSLTESGQNQAGDFSLNINFSRNERSSSNYNRVYLPYAKSDPPTPRLWAALRHVFPWASMKGCTFHWTQATFRKFNESWPDDDVRAAARDVLAGKEPPCPSLSATATHRERVPSSSRKGNNPQTLESL
ncbi:hypothetical protein MAR_035726 [Mya arenaria]|uniref:MULE transposase domain-containing protein n=1 Tax=Mya arenaria TaxID=6604 RepID=A0ABY7ELE3_MYAAR|nr:hypothetical protein MAR_035726 [Mya arenaria]